MKQLKEIEQEFWSKTRPARTLARQPLIPVYRVGELFCRGRHAWPAGGQFAFSPAGVELTLFRHDISREMVHEVRQGEIELALIAELPLIVLAYRFGEVITWDDVPYSWHLQPASCDVIPSVDCSPHARAHCSGSPLWVPMMVSFKRSGASLCRHSLRTRCNPPYASGVMPFNPDECTTAISKVFLDYPKTVDRLVLAKARTMGNE